MAEPSTSDFLIRPAAPADLPAIMAVMDEAVAALANPDWFIPDDEPYMAAHIDGPQGFCLVAEPAAGGAVAAYFTVKLAGTAPDALGHYLGLPEKELLATAQVDSCCVAPASRGHGLESRLLAAAEARLMAVPGVYRHLLGTVHPENAASLRSTQKCGYRVAATVRYHGDKLRHIMRKEL